MDKPESCAAPSVARSDVLLTKKDTKLQSLQCPLKSRGNVERQKLEDELNSLLKIIREKEASLKERTGDYDANQTRLKEIRQNKDATINQRKSIDDDLKLLNDEKKRETFIKLRGSLQYRTEEALNEAIRRLELQLATHNYRVLEEKKIVQEIDRLKRSRKTLHEYLALEQEQERMKNKQRMMRSQRDTLYRCVTSLKNDEEDMKRMLTESRSMIDQLKKDLDGLHAQRRKLLTDLQQTPQPHLQELQQNSLPHCRKRENGHTYQQSSQKDDSKSFKGRSVTRKKDRIGCKYAGNVLLEKEVFCNTLIAYLERLTVSPAVTPSTHITETGGLESVASHIQQDDTVLLLLRKKGMDCDDTLQKNIRSSKKGKRDRKRVQQNRLLIHTPDMLEQFYKLEVSPPSSLNDATACLEALSAKKQQLIYMRENAPSTVEQSSICCNKSTWKIGQSCLSTVSTCEDIATSEFLRPETEISAHGESATEEYDHKIGLAESSLAEPVLDDEPPRPSSEETIVARSKLATLANGFLTVQEDRNLVKDSVDPAVFRNLTATNDLQWHILAEGLEVDLPNKYILINGIGDERDGYVTRLSNGSVVPEDDVGETACKVSLPAKVQLTDGEVPGVLSMEHSLQHMYNVEVDIS